MACSSHVSLVSDMLTSIAETVSFLEVTVVQLLGELTYVGARFNQRNCKQICNL